MTVTQYESLTQEEKNNALKANGKLRVYQYMKDFKSITSMQAFIDCSETRLSGRIYDLKNDDGVNIGYEDITVNNRYGKPCRVRKYWIA